jgi:hypothetical protein
MVKRLQAAHKQILSVCSGTTLEPLIVESRFPNENRTCPITIKVDWDELRVGERTSPLASGIDAKFQTGMLRVFHPMVVEAEVASQFK